MIHNLQNDHLQISVSTLGAELQNMIHQKNKVEYLWQGDPAHWGRRSPVLFPIVGALKEGKYKAKGKTYEMSQHGFARNMEFELKESTENSLTYALASNEETLESYPYEFVLTIKYVLQENQLTVQFKIENPANKDLHFSIGAHPAFNCPLYPGEQRSDYSLQFEKSESISRQMIVGGTRNGETRPVLNRENTLDIAENLFDEDALIFEGLRSDRISIQKGDQPFLSMDFKGFPYFGIWSMSQKSPFVCLEPWHGIADHDDHSQQYAEKEGIIKLSAQEVFQSEYHLMVH